MGSDGTSSFIGGIWRGDAAGEIKPVFADRRRDHRDDELEFPAGGNRGDCSCPPGAAGVAQGVDMGSRQGNAAYRRSNRRAPRRTGGSADAGAGQALCGILLRSRQIGGRLQSRRRSRQISRRQHDTDEQAFEIAADNRYGLVSSVFTQDIDRAFRYIEEMPTGIVNINDTPNYWELHIPFGDMSGRDSGTGRVGGRHALTAMCDLKTATLSVR